MYAAKIAVELREATSRLASQLEELIIAECYTSSIDYILQSAMPVLKKSISMLCLEQPERPDEFLALRLLELASVPSELIIPVQTWFEGRVAAHRPSAKAECARSKIGRGEKNLGSCGKYDEHPGGQPAERLAGLLERSVVANNRGIIDHEQLTRVMLMVDPHWLWTEDDIKGLISQAGAIGDSPVDCKTFCEWLFQTPAGPTTTVENHALDCATPAIVDGVASSPWKGSPRKLNEAMPGLPHRDPVATLQMGHPKPPPRRPGLPPQKAPAPPPRSKSQPSKPPPKAGPKSKRHNSQPPVAVAPVSLAAALEEKRNCLRSRQQAHEPALAAGVQQQAPEAIVAEKQERFQIIRSLRELVASTRLGVADASCVLGGGASASRLGHGRFASVVQATVAVGEGTEVPVAAKRFAARLQVTDTGGQQVIVPISALRAAKREVEALCAVVGHPNVVKLLGMVLPPLDETTIGAGSVDVGEDGRLLQPPLQLLLGRCERSLFDFLGDGIAWGALGRCGRISLLQDAARGILSLHRADFAHLDIKSHNILMDPQAAGCWVAQICDLGSAFRVGGGQPPPEGTSGWTAPEILSQAHGSCTDPRQADVFSFGVVIWEVVSGRGAEHPLCGLAGDEYCAALAEGRRPSFPDRGACCHEEAELAAACWQFDAASRPNMHEVLDQLDVLHGQVHAHEETRCTS